MGILASNQNCIVGFTKLRKMGYGKGFHPKFLRLYLDKLEVEGLITTKMIGNKSEIRRVELDFEKEFSKFTKDLERIKLRATRKDLSDDQKFHHVFKYLSLALQKNNEIILGMIVSVYLVPNKNRIKINEKARHQLFLSMGRTLRLLKPEQRKILLNYLMHLNRNAIDEKHSQMLKKFI